MSDGLSPGDIVASVSLIEPIARGQRITCWRGQWPDGGAATVHVLHVAAKDREKDNFLGGAHRLQAAERGLGMRGVVPIAAVVPAQLAYVTRLSTAGTMEDVPILQWGVRDTVRFFRRVCTAMQQLHRAGIHHGCARPANVLLDDDLDPVLSDPGMLRIDDSYEGSSEARHDYSAYAAREVRIGHPASAASDVFSLGRLLYFCLHGEQPDEPDEELPLLAALEHAPPGLVRIVRRCTTRDPARRYPSVDALLDDLERFESPDVGLTHPRGREGETNPLSARASDSERPSSTGADPGDRPSWTGAAPSDRGRAGAAAQPPARRQAATPGRAAPGAVLTVEQGADDDLLSPAQARIAGLIGLSLVGAGVALAYYRGPSTAALGLGLLGAVGFSLLVPTLGPALVSRTLVAALFGAGAWFLDPISMAAEAGRVARFAEGDPTVRGQRVLAARARGQTDFSGLDLRQVKLENVELGGARFDESKLGGASFRGSDLRGASFADAVITDVDFSGADLSELDAARTIDWHTIRCSGDTRMPSGWSCEDGKPVAERDLPPTEPADSEPGRVPPAARRPPSFRDPFGSRDPLEGNLGKAPETREASAPAETPTGAPNANPAPGGSGS